jgi:(p)ppGpp synthase/HD superfamily hydrolase
MLKQKIIEAYNYAKEKHGDKQRSFTKPPLPYFSHPKAVARILEHITHNETLIIAGLLHDTLEDTDATYDEIKEMFGEKIAKIVLEVSSDSNKVKELGKKHYLANKMLNMSDDALTVKLADRYHNVLFMEHDDVPLKFIKKYWSETTYILFELQNRQFNEIQTTLINGINVTLKFLQLRFYLGD